MNDWNLQYIDADNIKTGEQYHHIADGYEKFMVKNGLLLDCADDYILKKPTCAIEFLNQLKSGNIDLGNQKRLLKTLGHLYDLCRDRSMFQPLLPLFIETMVYFRDNIDTHYENNGITDNLEDNDLSMEFGYGGYPNVISVCLQIARHVAVKKMIHTFATQHANPEGYRGDFYGEAWIMLSEPRELDLIEYLPGKYSIYDQPNAIIHKNNDGNLNWRLDFIGLSLYLNCLSLDKAALEGAASIISKGLNLQATVDWALKD